MSRLPRFIPALVSVAGVIALHGCLSGPQRPGEAGPLLGGHIAARAGRPGVVVAAPHGTSDARTAEIATTIAERTGFGLVVASGFSIERDRRGRAGRRYHVNRPLEGVAGRPFSEETATPEARRVFEEYVRRVSDVAQGPLLFYVEIHGNSRPQTAGHIEIATVGVDRELALRLRTLAEMIRDAHVRAHPEVVRLDILVEPADPVFHTASGARRDGILTLPLQALHIELPTAARVEFAGVYTSILADFLGQAVALPPGR
jgi:hypothetical protein